MSMQVVVTDTDPLRDLMLINQIDRLFTAVTVPMVVRDELLHPNRRSPCATGRPTRRLG